MSARAWNLQRLRSDSSYWRSSVLLAAAHLDLFGWIGKRKTNPKALAAHFGGTAVGWKIFLDALCGMGLMRKRGDKYANTAFAAHCLCGDDAASLLPAYDAWNAWGDSRPFLSAETAPQRKCPLPRIGAKLNDCFAVWISMPGRSRLIWSGSCL